MVPDWISHDTHLSKYLVIFGLSPKMDVILWVFHGYGNVRIYWSSQKCPYLVYLLQGVCGVKNGVVNSCTISICFARDLRKKFSYPSTFITRNNRQLWPTWLEFDCNQEASLVRSARPLLWWIFLAIFRWNGGVFFKSPVSHFVVLTEKNIMNKNASFAIVPHVTVDTL